jgi:metallophosphoesterase (TIGR00282 family)
MKDSINILAIGDIVGRPGRDILKNRLQGLRDIHRADFIIANGENTSGGRSVTHENFIELKTMGIDLVTSGNHIWDRKESFPLIEREMDLIRPANYPSGAPGAGWRIKNAAGINVCVVNLIGRVYLQPTDCPFKKFDEIYEEVKEKSDVIVVDFHAEATSEKRAFGWYVDGRASLVFGTHTHVQTADEEILPKGTGYITDIGMTGAFDSVIGMDKFQSIDKFITQIGGKKDVATGDPRINAVLVKVLKNGKTESIKRIAV